METENTREKESAKIVYVDLTHSIANGDMSYTGDPATAVRQWATIEKDHFRLKQVSFGSHSSTHMDSPSHLMAKGKNLDAFAPSSFFHEAFVLNAKNNPRIGADQVHAIPPGVTGVLFYTGWQERWNSKQYFEDPPLLTKEATTLLLERGIRLFGFDSSSCDALGGGNLPIHHLILSYDGLILENLNNLDKIAGRKVSLVALPLLLQDSDGAPTRVIASYKA